MTSLRGETLFRRGNPVCLSRFIFWQVDRHRLRLRDDEGALAVRDDEQSDAAIHVYFSRFSSRPVDRHRLRLRDDEGALAVRDDKQSDAAIYLLACREEKPFKRAVFKALKGFVRVMFGL